MRGSARPLVGEESGEHCRGGALDAVCAEIFGPDLLIVAIWLVAVLAIPIWAIVDASGPHASLVAILHAPKTVHTASQAAITATAMAVDSGNKYDESRSPAGPFRIP